MKVRVIAYPYARQEGTIEVPNGVENLEEYVSEHFDEVRFGKVELDYKGTDFDVEE